MSYLDVPRLHFAGTFIAQPSTLNNTGSNYEPSVTNPYPSWNPNGSHYWQFLDCTVQTAVTGDGPVQDPIIGVPVNSTNTPAPAKLVDLDTEQQLVSQIWGLQIKVAISDTDYFVGNFRPVAFNDINFGREIGGSGDAAASACFQSVLDNVTWGSQISSPFLQQLRSASPDCLSIKFVVDRYNQNIKHGRIVGTIGPALCDEPSNFVLGRALRPAAQGSQLWFGYAKVDQARQKVVVDLGNSIPTTVPDGNPPSNLGTLQVAIIPPSGSPMILGDYDYSPAAYQATAGIQEFPATADQLTALANTPLGVIQTAAPGAPPAVPLQEGANCTYVNATQMVYRMNPGDVADVEIIALQFGERAANQQISLTLNASLLQPAPISAAPPVGQTPTANIPVATPTSALTFTTGVTTDADGKACFQIIASDPGNPREFIDGQVYNVGYSWALDQDASFPTDPNGSLSVLVFDTYPGEPTWEDIQPFLAQYAKLYPFMDGLVPPGLDNPTTYQQNLDAFKEYLSFPITDPRFMPVTRDMSRDKRQLLIGWLNAGAPGPAT